MAINNKLNSIVTNLFFRTIILCFGIALFIFFGIPIFASIINPQIWFDALIAIYLLLSAIFSIVYFFSKKLLHFMIILPALGYFLFSLIWLGLS